MACRYQDPFQQAEKKRRLKSALRPAGFQLWLSQITTDGLSVATIGYVIFALVTLCSLIQALAGLLMASMVGVVIMLLAAFFWTFCLLILLKSRQLALQGNVNLGVLRPFWNGLLMFARKMEWERYDARLVGRLVIDMRKTPVSNLGLEQLPGLKNCQVLDLQYSNIDDDGLKVLYGLNKLCCLVVQNTGVTSEGITHLQQHRPQLWIWY